MKPVCVSAFEASMSRLLLRHPFWGALALNLTVRAREDIQAPACTDGRSIFVHPEKIKEIPEDSYPMVVFEETAHCAMGHLARRPAGAEMRLWNQACDQEVRWMMEEENETDRKAGKPPLWRFPGEQYAPQAQFRGMSAEAVYAVLAAAKPPAKGKPDKAPKGGSSPSPSGPPAASPSPGTQPGAPADPGQDEPADPGAMGDFAPAPDESPSEAAALAKDWEQRLLHACRMGRARGHMPGAAARRADDIIHPKSDPFALLRAWLTERGREDYSWQKPARRWAGSEFFLPSLDSPRCGRIVFATDTSGSIGRHLLGQFRGLKQWALDELKPTRITDIFVDAAIQTVRDYEPGDEIPDDCPGGGGTSFVPVFEHANGELDEVPILALVFLTDLDGTFPDVAPPYPVLWLCPENRRTAPFGEVVRIPRD